MINSEQALAEVEAAGKVFADSLVKGLNGLSVPALVVLQEAFELCYMKGGVQVLKMVVREMRKASEETKEPWQ